MKVEITAIEHRLTERTPKEYWLEVVWQFRNPTQRPLYVLTKGPYWMEISQPIVLNHSETRLPPTIEPHAAPEMEFAEVAAGDTLQLRRDYPLPALDLHISRTVIGKFAVGYQRPNAAWHAPDSWEAVQQWRQVVESASFEIKAAGR